MAIPDDYVGKQFGSFFIDRHAAVGGHSEIYICKHLPTQRYYNLKLSIEEDALWEGEPLLPPINGYCQKTEVEVTWSVANRDRPYWPGGLVYYYQVIDSDYVIPLCSPWRLKDALSIQRVFALGDAVRPTLHELSVVSDAAGAMLADAAFRDIGTDSFMSVWGTLVGDDKFLAIQRPAIEALPISAQERASNWLLRDRTGPRFSDNRLLWLYAAMIKELISPDECSATLMCRWYRLNISNHEIEQFAGIHVGLGRAERYYSHTLDLSKQTVELVLRPLASRAYTPYHEPNLFVKRETSPPTITRDSLVLQSITEHGSPLIEMVRKSGE